MFLLAQADSSGGGSSSLILTVVFFGAVFYFLMIRPQRNRVRKQQNLASTLEVGDQVRTVGGVFGVVVGIKQDSIVLGVEEDRIRVAFGAIASRIGADHDEIDEITDKEA